MAEVLRKVEALGGTVSIDVWIALLAEAGLPPKRGNWTFGRTAPFMRSDGGSRVLTDAGSRWAARA